MKRKTTVTQDKIDPKAFTQIYSVLKCTGLICMLPEDEIAIIKNSMDHSYTYSYDKNVPMKKQCMMEDTKKLLSYYYCKYLQHIR